LKHIWCLLYLPLCSQFLFAQEIDCEKITSFLNKKESQVEQLNLSDPDYISFHYIIAQDITNELKQFRNEVIPFFTACSNISFSELINRYDALVHDIQIKHDSLALLSKKVYLIFYEKALYEYQLNNDADAQYFLDRSLQYNTTYPDAILLKLNKLLDANHFEECLPLLNILYYETQLDRAQEMQAIEFTDKFYDKLYKTGDSLVKREHASEALVLFEILEIFCQNIPTAYCNDDYYHGVLRSKSGIYESYIAVAKVAEKRGNVNIAQQFYEYAKEYLAENPHIKSNVTNVTSVTDVPGVKGVKGVVSEKNVKKVDEVSVGSEVISKMESVEPKVSSKEMKEKYDKIVFQALALCIKEDFTGSYTLFLEAKKMEECRCFTQDFRVDLMIQELSKMVPD